MEHIYGTRYEHEYINLVEKVLATGKSVKSRNGSVVSTFGETLEIDQRAGKFHLLAGRPLPLKSTIGEFAALLREPKHVQDFHDQNCKYWDQWADDDGALRVDYGNAWYNWEGTNQVLNVVNTLRNRPHDRRHIVTGWNPSNLGELSLPCCHMLYQWYVTDEGYLNMLWYQRSADLMVGVPADVILAQLFNMCMAAETGLSPGKIKFMFVDCHIYMSHLPGVREYLSRRRRLPSVQPRYVLRARDGLLTGLPQDRFTSDDITISDYYPLEPIKFEVAK